MGSLTARLKMGLLAVIFGRNVALFCNLSSVLLLGAVIDYDR